MIEHLKENLIKLFDNPESRFSWYFILLSYLVAYVFYVYTRKNGKIEFSKDAFNFKLYFNLSTWVDLVIFTVAGFYLLDLFFGVNPDVVYTAGRKLFKIEYAGLFPGAADNIFIQITWTTLRLVVGDFAYYLYHWLMHNVKSLWFFHATHHSARTLNFFTAYRLHPVDALVSNLILGLAGGIFALITVVLFGQESIRLLIFGFVFYMPVRAVVANLRHSHVWMVFPNWLNKIIMSPAHHQIHHWNDTKYYFVNYTNDFAFIDKMFGTLHIPTEEDKKNIVFGVDEKELNMDAGSVWSTHWQPFVNLYDHWKKKLS
jgi:sterol desaturase/sphingolipid hydroxylase (fatty acid hydroxylase superfamily)